MGDVFYDLELIDGTIDSASCVEMLEINLEQFIAANNDHEFWFQQDNAKSHTSNYTKDYFTEIGMPIIEWPAFSPDLNTIENQ